MENRLEPLMRRWFEGVWNRGDLDVIDELLAPQAVVHETAVESGQPVGAGDFKTIVRTLRGAVPDIHFAVDRHFEGGGHMATHLTVTGTHTGPGLGVPPTGRSFRITGIALAQVRDGRIVEAWSSFDLLGLFAQLGLVRRPALGGGPPA